MGVNKQVKGREEEN